MTELSGPRVDWALLWRSGDLLRFCLISLGILLHAGMETMLSTIMAPMIAEIGGVQLVGWSLAIYEVGAILAGVAAGRLALRWSIAPTLIAASLIYSLGCVIAAAAPTMPVLLVGRLLEGLGGGGLVSMAFVATERLFPRAIWPQLFSILSVVWGVAAFGGPLTGASIAAIASWRWAFGVFAVAGFLLAGFYALFLDRRGNRQPTEQPVPGRFPVLPLLCLAAGVMAISAAGVDIEALRSSLLLAAGLTGVALFFKLDAANPVSRLFPAHPFRPATRLGAGFIMVGMLSVATVSFGVYAPLLLVSLHGLSPLATGYIIASESLSWSVLSILVANSPARNERAIIFGGAIMITLGIAGFAYAIPEGQVALIVASALLQGGGFGIAWPFAIRRIVEAARPEETTITASAVPALQRMGYAIGAALAGLIANLSGFSGGFTREAAAAAAPVLFLAFIPIAMIGCIAAYRLSKPVVDNVA